MADVEQACGAGALDLFADLQGSSGSQAAQAEAAAAAQSTAVNAEGASLSHLAAECMMRHSALFWCTSLLFRTQACLQRWKRDIDSQANSSLDRSGRARQTTCS